MPNYRRAIVPGASWFFTVNVSQRRNNDLLVRHIDVLRASVRRAHRLHPFTIDALGGAPRAYALCLDAATR